MVYAPGTEETDPKKQNMSLQQNAAQNLTNANNIATNTAAIAALQTGTVTTIAGNSGAFTLNGTSGLTNTVNDIKLSQASSSQFGAVKVDNSTITASAGVISVAVAAKSDQTTATSTTLEVTPGRQQFHPSAAKAWVNIAAAGTINASYGVSGVVRNSAGNYTITFSTAFTSANFATVCTSIASYIFSISVTYDSL